MSLGNFFKEKKTPFFKKKYVKILLDWYFKNKHVHVHKY